MTRSRNFLISLALICAPLQTARTFARQQPPPRGAATLRGRITYAATGEPIHNVGVQIVQLRRSDVTGDDGRREPIRSSRTSKASPTRRAP